MEILDHFEITEIGGKFTLVDRSVTPGRTVSIHDSAADAQNAFEQASVVPAEWLRAESLEAIAVALAERSGVSYATVIAVLETLGEDQVWALADESLETIERFAGLAQK